MKSKKNFYAVKVGRVPGIYGSWDECKAQTHQFKGAVYKAWETLEQAERYVGVAEAGASAGEKPGTGKRQEANPVGQVRNPIATEHSEKPVSEGSLASGAPEPIPRKPRQRKSKDASDMEVSTEPASVSPPEKRKKRKTVIVKITDGGDSDSSSISPDQSPPSSGSKKKRKSRKLVIDLPSSESSESSSSATGAKAKSSAASTHTSKKRKQKKVRSSSTSPDTSDFGDEADVAACLAAAEVFDNIPPGATSLPALEVYTDGSCQGNGLYGARAGIGVFYGPGDPRNLSERVPGSKQTNNRAELLAVIRAIETAPPYHTLTIYSDSTYMRKGITEWMDKWKKKNWKSSTGKEVLNEDLWKNLDSRRSEYRGVVVFKYVPAHVGVPGNEGADYLANRGAEMAAIPSP
ncbi:hypothetical protein HK104_003680 [Borealophlyctis nickersoniae]|nr:hypothetical protein HK104_003680 [Borealophlyctis nickersoniae]